MNGREFIAVHSYACLNKIPLRYAENCLTSWLPVGSVEFVHSFLGKEIVPDYYPVWAKPLIKRKIWHEEYQSSDECFIKPDRYKKFNGFVCKQPNSGIINHAPFGDFGYWCSEIVNFTNEWRLYICNGEILDSGWYQGDDEEKPCPEIDLDLKGVYGALDIGETESGIQLVEFQHPFACGWYGENKEAYVKFLTEGYLKL